jgi:hypothetical protein
VVAVVKWEAAPSAVTILSTEMNSLANNTPTAASSEYDNSSNLNVYAWFELAATFAVSPNGVPPMVDLYMTRALDGTNHETGLAASGGANQQHLYLGSFQVLGNTGAQRITLGPVLLPPSKLKFYIDNRSGQAMTSSGHTLKMYPANLESQ